MLNFRAAMANPIAAPPQIRWEHYLIEAIPAGKDGNNQNQKYEKLEDHERVNMEIRIEIEDKIKEDYKGDKD